ncbi:MAG: hypothetical protein RR842_11435 [Gordonibacter sp.]|uniref:hypothetical protein n=1 Tax=Gordonibacter sp. TaxID=1968902 RepID=UPI002FC95491
MYENMINDYRICFEGLPDPVFYKSFYPPGGCGSAKWLWDFFNYAQGLKLDKDKEGHKFEEYHRLYIDDIRDLLNAVMRDNEHSKRGVVVIPSSKKDAVNRVTEIVREVLARNPSPYKDLTRVVVRTEDKPTAHSGGKRSIRGNVDTLKVLSPQEVKGLKVVVVIDDILTSGSSFRGMNQVLRDAGFEGLLVNFAFARTLPSEAIGIYVNHESGFMLKGFPRMKNLERNPPSKNIPVEHGCQIVFNDGSCKTYQSDYEILKKAGYIKCQTESGAYRAVFDPAITLRFSDGSVFDFSNIGTVAKHLKNVTYRPPIDGIIFDLDQTLLEDTIRDIAYEENPYNASPFPYKPYDGVRELMKLHIPFAVVSNRPESNLINIIQERVVEEALYPDWHEGSDAADAGISKWNTICHGHHNLDQKKVFIPAYKLPENVFSFPSETIDGYKCCFYKPCTRGIDQAKNWLIDQFPGLEKDSRIIGLGNTHEDIISYNTAGIESCLALWGVPEYLKTYALDNWGADYVLYNLKEFIDWCRNGGV